MIRVTIELLRHGSEAHKRHLGTIEIANDGTGDADMGNYSVRLSKFGNPMSTWKRGAVTGFARRKRGPFDLLLLALLRTVGTRISTEQAEEMMELLEAEEREVTGG